MTSAFGACGCPSSAAHGPVPPTGEQTEGVWVLLGPAGCGDSGGLALAAAVTLPALEGLRKGLRPECCCVTSLIC